MAVRMWSMVASRSSGGALQRDADRENALDDLVVEVPRDPVPVFQHAQQAHRCVESVVLNRHTSGQGQCPHHELVLFAESVGVHFVGQVEIPIDLSSDPYGNSEKRVHRWVMSRVPVAVGMGAKIIQAQSCGIGD